MTISQESEELASLRARCRELEDHLLELQYTLSKSYIRITINPALEKAIITARAATRGGTDLSTGIVARDYERPKGGEDASNDAHAH